MRCSVLSFLKVSLSIIGIALAQAPDIHGFLSQGYVQSTQNNYLSIRSKQGSFEFNEAGINFSVPLSDKLRGGLQFLSRDIGDQGNNQVMLDWAILDYRWTDYLGVRAGKIKTPLGLYNEGRDIDALRTFVLLPQSVYDETIRDFTFAYQGLCVYGNMPLTHWGDMEYQAYIGTFNIPNSNSGFWRMSFDFIKQNIDGLAGLVLQSASLSSKFENTKVTGERSWGGCAVWETPLNGIRIGGYFMAADLQMSGQYEAAARRSYDFPEEWNLESINTTETAGSTVTMDVTVPYYYTVAAEWILDRLTVACEYHARSYEVGINARTFGFASTDLVMDFDGYYTLASYRFMPWLEAGAYYSVFNDTDSGRDAAAVHHKLYQKDLCGVLRFDLTRSWLIKIEGHLMDGATQAYAYENPEGRQDEWTFVAVKTSINF